MKSVKEISEKVEYDIRTLNFSSKPKNLFEPISYTLNLGGKRVRPLLVHLASTIYNGNKQNASYLASAIEVFHNFTLVHDDIMDNAPIRRGKDAVHVKWGKNTAILSGDVMLVEAYKLIQKVSQNILSQSLLEFNKTAVEVCQGQQLDMNFETQDSVTETEYLEMIRLKTAVLLGCSLKVGAINGNASENDQQNLYDFGVNVGIAFQIQDDILDSYGDPDKFGKKVGGDISENKKTLLLIKALELADQNLKNKIYSLFNETNEQRKIEQMIAVYNELDVRSIAEQYMNNYFEKALKNLSDLSVKNEEVQILKELAISLMKREN